MNIDQVIGKSVCLLLMSKDDSGEDDWAVLLGEITVKNGSLLFQNSDTPTPFALPDDTLARIQVPTEDIRRIVLDADYYLPLSVGPTPEGPEGESYIKTGLKWPEK